MSKYMRIGLLLIAFMLWLSPAQAWAYSYGDANTEDVAETFKLVVSSVGGSNAEWTTAAEAHKVRRSEIASHFGEDVALTLDKNIEAKDSALLIANYKAVLVMNLDRRFTYASKDPSDYAGAKLLLAKAKATFDTLAPYMSSGTDEINTAFDEALEALGNPGLFGVGQKDADPDTFKQKVNFIYGKVSPKFPYKAYVKPAKEPASTPKPSPTKGAAASAKPKPSSQPAETAAEAKPQTVTPAAEATASEEPSPTPAAAEAGEDTAAGAGTEAAAAEDEPAAEASTLEEAASDNTAAADSGEAAADDAASESELAASGAEGHAPMDRTDRTNTTVTIIVIAGVILAGGGGLFFARKKGLL